jgi:hypothetical protein
MIRTDLEAGQFIRIMGEDTLGVLMRRDPQHIYLWDVLIGHTIVSVHVSKISSL